MSFFSRLFGRRGKRRPAPAREPSIEGDDPVDGDEPAEEDGATEPTADGAGPSLAGEPARDDDRLLQDLLSTSTALALSEQSQLRELLEAARRDRAHPPAIDQARVLHWVSTLVASGQERVAIDLLGGLTRLVPGLGALRLRLAELHYDRLEFAEALPLLQETVDDPQLAPRAHFLLGDYHAREADLERGLRHYEAALAFDFAYPRARERADELRRRLDRPVAAASPTILGAEDISTSSRYVLQRELGRGGSGTVYLARDRILGRLVAVKALHAEVKRRPDAWTHLFCEARIAAALQHPRIAAVYDLDEAAHLVVMEYCAGGTLADRIVGGPLPAPLVLRRLAEVTEVLDVVHRCGVVHRDLKPANLLCRVAGPQPPEVAVPPLVLTDFGIAHAGRADEELAAAGSLVYMSPEQRGGMPADPRADLYACGVIFLEMLLGRPPLDRHQALQGTPIVELEAMWGAVRGLAPSAVAPALLELARSLVDPSPERRPSDAASVGARARAIGRALEERAEREELRAEIERRAGPPPRSAEVERWLQAEHDGLASGPGAA
jgi:tetratricopeptide (TPR) repeat protein